MALRYACLANSIDSLVLTHLDVYDTLDDFEACVAYRVRGKLVEHFPASVRDLEDAEPVLRNFRGWKRPLGPRPSRSCRSRPRTTSPSSRSTPRPPVDIVSVGLRPQRDHREEEPVDTILILDFGSQYTQLIGRRVRELGVYTEIVPGDAGSRRRAWTASRASSSPGSPWSVYDADAPRPIPPSTRSGLPVLGICYGIQRMTWDHGGKVATLAEREYGTAHGVITPTIPCFEGVPRPSQLDEPRRFHRDGGARLQA